MIPDCIGAKRFLYRIGVFYITPFESGPRRGGFGGKRGYADIRICGYADIRICGYTDMRICGYADMRIYGYADIQ